MIQPGLERLGPALGSPSSSLTVLLTATGRTGHSGGPAVRLVVEELSLEIDSATDLSMEGRIVKGNGRRAGSATLGAVQWMVTSWIELVHIAGAMMGAGILDKP